MEVPRRVIGGEEEGREWGTRQGIETASSILEDTEASGARSDCSDHH